MGSVLGRGSQVDADTRIHPELVLLPLVATASLPGRVRQGLYRPWHPPWEGLDSSQLPVWAPVSMTTTQLIFPGHFHFKCSVLLFARVPVSYSEFPFLVGK